MRPGPLHISICIPTLEPGDEVSRFLANLRDEPLPNGVRLAEIIVVTPRRSAGRLAGQFGDGEARVGVLLEPRPRGKAAALRAAAHLLTGEVVVVANGDALPCAGAIGELLAPYAEGDHELVAFARPFASARGFVGRLFALLWRIHDAYIMCRGAGRAHLPGELFAVPLFLLRSLRDDVVNDDSYLLRRAKALGLRVAYLRRALVRTKAPADIAAFFFQRLRINRGHLQELSATARDPPGVLLGILASPPSGLSFFACVVKSIRSAGEVPLLLALAGVEAWALALAVLAVALGLKQRLPWRRG
mgnify:CR=1 FL=1